MNRAESIDEVLLFLAEMDMLRLDVSEEPHDLVTHHREQLRVFGRGSISFTPFQIREHYIVGRVIDLCLDEVFVLVYVDPILVVHTQQRRNHSASSVKRFTFYWRIAHTNLIAYLQQVIGDL